MFDTETMAELCIKQGLPGEALAIYRRLAAATQDGDKRRLYAARIGALVHPADEPSDVTSPALQMLVLRHTPDGIAAEPRTVPLSSTEGRTALGVPVRGRAPRDPPRHRLPGESPRHPLAPFWRGWCVVIPHEPRRNGYGRGPGMRVSEATR